jgi:hypothetical protein
VLAWAVNRLRDCYPETSSGVFDVIIERIKANHWGDERIRDAIDHLVETHVYATINPANILSWDKRKKLLSYNDMIDEVNKYGESVWKKYEVIEIKGKRYWLK